MVSDVISPICLFSGLLIIAAGLLGAQQRLQHAARLSRKAGLIHPAMPEEWGQWFYQGFANLTAATQGVVTFTRLAVWIALGALLISLGWRLA